MSSDNGNGGGKGFFDNIVNVESFSGKGNFFENLGNDFINFSTQMGTGGYLGYEDGKISNGATTNLFKKTGKETVSGLKEITGAKAAEEANLQARQQFEETKANAQAARVEAQQQLAKDQLQQSNIAGAARAKRTTSANKGQPVPGVTLGADERDFLGL
jgi:hypothetical protein